MKIKILFYIDTLRGGGAEKVLRTLVNAMDQNKFDITVQTTFREETENILSRGIKYKYCYKNKNPLSEIIFRAEAEANLVYPLHIKDDYHIEVAYLEAASTKIMAGSTNKKAKKLAWVHCDLRKITGGADDFVKKSAQKYKKFHKVIGVSENVKESFKELFGNEPESLVIYNTIDDKEILEKSLEVLPADITKNKFTLLMLGRLMPQKNYPRLLKSARTLLNEGFDFDLWILGEGEERPELEKIINENNLNNNVYLLGFRENPYPFIIQSDLLVCSSNYEGFSTFVAEGLILGKPIVTTDCSGMDELLGENEFGLITPNDDEAFTDGLRKMLADKDLLNTYTKRAQIRGQQFSKDTLVKQTENFFLNLLNN